MIEKQMKSDDIIKVGESPDSMTVGGQAEKRGGI